MLPYLTPDRYAVMGLGTTAQSAATLLSLINRASLAVDRFCSIPMVPARYSFRGGSVTEEEHRFNLGNNVNEMPTRTIWPRSTPVRSVSQLRVYITNTQYVDFATSELFVTKNNINITSVTLTSAGLFGALAVPIVGLAQPIAKISYDYGFDFDSVDEMLGDTGSHLVYRAQNQFWNDDDVVVKKNGAVQSSGFTVDKTEGTVTFGSALLATDIVTATYGYSLPSEVAEATALTVAKFISDKEIIERGMGGVESLRVGEIAIERPRQRAAIGNQSVDLPNEAKQLLDGLNFITIR